MNRISVLGAAALCVAVALAPRMAAADLGKRVKFDIAPQQLPSALLKYAEQSGVQVTSPGALAEGKKSPGVVGTFVARGALDQLLKDTNLRYDVVGENTVIILAHDAPRQPSPTEPGKRGEPAAKLRLARADEVVPDAAYKRAQEESAREAEAARQDSSSNGDGELVIFGQRIVTRNREETVEPVLVYEAAYFERFEPLTLYDMLKRVPGVYFDQLFNLPGNSTGNYFADTSGTLPRLRNLDAQFSQILVNGRRIAGVDFGGGGDAFLATLPAEAIKQIRVIRSPSAEIDSSGVGMTLDIVLKDGSKYRDSSWRTGASVVDGNAEGVGSVSISGGTDRMTYGLSATVQNRTGTGRSYGDYVATSIFEIPGLFTDRLDYDAKTTTLSSQLDRDRSLIGNIGLDIGAYGKASVEAKYVETGRMADTRSDGVIRSRSETDYGDGSPPDVSETVESGFGRTKSARDTSNYGLALGYKQDEGRFRMSSLLAYDRTDIRSHVTRDNLDDDGQPFTSNINDARGSGDRIQMNHRFAWRFMPDHEVRAGVDWQRSTDVNYNVGRTNRSPAPNDGFTTRFSEDAQTIKRLDSFAVYEWRIVDPLSLQLGIRHEQAGYDSNAPAVLLISGITPAQFQFDPDVLSTTRRTPFAASVSGTNPSAHLRWELNDHHQLRLSVAQTVRRPSLNELDPRVYLIASTTNALSSQVEVGNPFLKNEEALGIDAGYDWRFRDGIVGINFFGRRIENLIEQASISPQRFAQIRPDLSPEIQRLAVFLASRTPPRALPLITRLNTEKQTKVHGAELDMSFPLYFISDLAHFYMNATYSRQERTGEPASDASAINISYDHELKATGFTYGASVNWITRNKTYSESLDFIDARERKLDPNLEVFVEKKWGRTLLTRLSVENLTDAEDRVVSSSQERGFFVGESSQLRLTESDPRITLTMRGKF